MLLTPFRVIPRTLAEWNRWIRAQSAAIEAGDTTIQGGAWGVIASYSFSGDQSEYEYTWDISLYDEIRVVLNQVQPASDGVSLYLITGHGGTVGQTGVATMFESTNDYDNIEQLWEGTGAPFAGPDTDKMRIAASCSNAANETISGDVIISHFLGSDLGCAMKAELLYINSSSNMRAYESKGFLDDGNNAEIDTLRLFFASGDFANTGSVRIWGRRIAS